MVSTKNIKELSLDRDFRGSFPVRTRYAILSSPRSGSTLLGRMLFETRMAGDPIEYLSSYLLVLERERTGRESLSYGEFIRSMESRRTSENGMFGMQIHYSQLLSAFSSSKVNEAMKSFILGFDKLIWVRRRDRLRQAVSLAIARRTDAWSSEDNQPIGIRHPSELHPIECMQALSVVCQNDFGWDKLIKIMNLDACVVWYEDLADSYHEQSVNVLRHLELDSSVTKIPEPPIHRQASELNEQVLNQFRAYLGVAET
jgi:LPS sulfotransferase NodH